jgi:hypothetical protein
MTDQLRWIEAAIQKANEDYAASRAPNIGRVDPHSFAALAYLTEYDRLAEQERAAIKRACGVAP